MKRIIIAVFLVILASSLCACSYIPGIVELSLPDREIQIERDVPQPLHVSYTTEDQQSDFKSPAFHRVKPADVVLEFRSADKNATKAIW